MNSAILKLFKSGFFHIFGSSVINKIIGFLSSVVLVRILTKSEYGTFAYAWNIYSIVILLNGLGIENGVLQLSSEKSGDTCFANKVSNYGIRFGLYFNLLLVFVLLCIGMLVPLKISGGKQLLCALCLLPMVQLFYNMTLCYLRSQKRNQEYAKLAVIHSALLFIVSAGCSFVFREIGMVVGHYVAYIVTYLVGLFIFHVHLINRNTGEIGADKRPLLKISFISMLNNGLSQLIFLLDVFILGIVDPQETILASYKVATMIPVALSFIPSSLMVYLYPYFAEHKDDGKWLLGRYKQILVWFGGFNLTLSAVLFTLAPFIICIVFGEQYLDAVPVFRLLAINYFFSATFRTVSGNLLVTQRKLNFNFFVAVISSLTNIVTDYFFIQWWGSMGAAVATMLVVLISGILNTAYLVYTFKQKLKLQRGVR